MQNQTLQRPTPNLVREYVTQFENDPECVATDAAIALLIRTFPNNSNIEEVLLKVAAVNQLYNAGVYTRAVYAVAELICRSDVDSKLDQGSLGLVDEIAHTEITGENHRYVFATKYCHWHRPAVYPSGLQPTQSPRLLQIRRWLESSMTSPSGEAVVSPGASSIWAFHRANKKSQHLPLLPS